jgi:DNA-binding GntR family transcriptional regulator
MQLRAGRGRLEFRTREQLVYEFLRRAITEGRWGPDDAIVGSRVAEELGVSRITIANALKRLAGEGFVRLTPHKEALVAPLDPGEIEEIYLMRAALESEAVAQASQRATPADLRELRALNEQIGAARSRGLGAVRTADLVLHRRVRTLACKPLLNETIDNLVDRCEYYRARLLDSRGVLTPEPRVHEELLRALETADAERARAYTREHVLRGLRSLLALLQADRQEQAGRPTQKVESTA